MPPTSSPDAVTSMTRIKLEHEYDPEVEGELEPKREPEPDVIVISDDSDDEQEWHGFDDLPKTTKAATRNAALKTKSLPEIPNHASFKDFPLWYYGTHRGGNRSVVMVQQAIYPHFHRLLPPMPNTKDWDAEAVAKTKPERDLSDKQMEGQLKTIYQKHRNRHGDSISAFKSHPVIASACLDYKSDKTIEKVHAAARDLYAAHDAIYQADLRKRVTGFQPGTEEPLLKKVGDLSRDGRIPVGLGNLKHHTMKGRTAPLSVKFKQVGARSGKRKAASAAEGDEKKRR